MSSIQQSESREFVSCTYLEGGLSFAYGKIKACAFRHSGRGAPDLLAYTGGDVAFNTLESSRQQIVQENQTDLHAQCKGCPNLQRRAWPEREYEYRWLGITHYVLCNLSCDYCWLQWAPWSPYARKKPAQRYSMAPVVKQLIDECRLDPQSVIDWGGGGEPTMMPEFDECFELLHSYGATQWLHTNAVRVPKAMGSNFHAAGRVKILCSLDAGLRESYKLIKGRDRFDVVFENLHHYARAGAQLTLKYIMLEDNCDVANIRAFVKRAKELGSPAIVTDIDYREPDPSTSVRAGLRRMQLEATRAGLHCSFGSTGDNANPLSSIDVMPGRAQRVAFSLKHRVQSLARGAAG